MLNRMNPRTTSVLLVVVASLVAFATLPQVAPATDEKPKAQRKAVLIGDLTPGQQRSKTSWKRTIISSSTRNESGFFSPTTPLDFSRACAELVFWENQFHRHRAVSLAAAAQASASRANIVKPSS
jgi:hypothetical protein